MAEVSEIPKKRAYKRGEVCQYTDTQPYVLQFWESEFPQLKPGKSRAGQMVYTKKHIDIILRIKQLLYEEDFTISGARRQLDKEKKRKGGVVPKPVSVKKGAAPVTVKEEAKVETVERSRYEDAVDEIANLRLQLKDVELELQEARKAYDMSLERSEKAIEQLEELLEKLS
jgi:DNA-binding transcriptional MerR regulator